MNYLELLTLLGPQAVLVLAALVVLAVDLGAMRNVPDANRRYVCALFAFVACVVAALWTIGIPAQANLLEGMLVIDPLTRWVTVALLALAALTVALSVDGNFTSHVGEYFAIILLATLGMIFLVSTEDLLMIFVSLELTSICLYLLTAFNRENPAASEAALKYFLFGGMAAAFTLFGLSLLYGLTGTTNLPAIARTFAARPLNGLDPLLAVAITMTAAGFAFKVAAAPFHLWAPDTYQGAPVPSAALIASGSKVAGFFVFAKVMVVGLTGAEGSASLTTVLSGWTPLVAGLAAISMIVGNLAAIAQSHVRRLLAYSAVAHAGYALVAVVIPAGQGLPSLVYYTVTYALAALGAFAVIAVMQANSVDDTLSSMAGLHRRSPFVAGCMLVFILSLAGIPPLAGFFGKFYVFAAALRGGSPPLALLWLVVLAIAASAVSLYYYLQVLKQIYVRSPKTSMPAFEVPLVTGLAMAASAAGVVLLGCFPEPMIRGLIAASRAAGF